MFGGFRKSNVIILARVSPEVQRLPVAPPPEPIEVVQQAGQHPFHGGEGGHGSPVSQQRAPVVGDNHARTEG